MCCCSTNSFCCTHDLKKGIIIAGGVDIAVIGMLMIANIAVYHQISGPYSLWYLTELIVIIADVLLILGAMNNNPGLMLVWLIIAMINIVFLFMGWIAVPIMALLNYGSNFCYNTRNWKELEGQELEDWKYLHGQNLEDFTIAVDVAFVVVLPVYYINLWATVKCHRENLVREENMKSPIE